MTDKYTRQYLAEMLKDQYQIYISHECLDSALALMNMAYEEGLKNGATAPNFIEGTNFYNEQFVQDLEKENERLAEALRVSDELREVGKLHYTSKLQESESISSSRLTDKYTLRHKLWIVKKELNETKKALEELRNKLEKHLDLEKSHTERKIIEWIERHLSGYRKL